MFDNPQDSLVDELSQATLFGVDVTDFLDNALTRSPVTLYLFHVIRTLLDGRKLVCWMDEFWRLLGDPAFENFAKDGPKTWRKLNGVMCVATQSASDVLESPISRTIIEQTPTKILFPNPDANAAEYIEGFGLSEREFKLIKEQMEPGSRQFLVKQGHYSVVCELEPQGLRCGTQGDFRPRERRGRAAPNHGRDRSGPRALVAGLSILTYTIRSTPMRHLNESSPDGRLPGGLSL